MVPPSLRKAAARLGRPRRRDAIAGLVTGLFSLPEGMAYASIAGFPPAAGIYAGVAPTIVGSLFARTVLMVTTLTSAIALTSRSVLHEAGLDTANPANLAALALGVGIVMLLLGVLKLGSIMNFVSNAVMTGFTTGIAVQIIAGVLGDATGYTSTKHNTLAKLGDWIAHAAQWDLVTCLTTLACAAVWLGAWMIRPIRSAATLIALLVSSFGVFLARVDVETVADIGVVPSSLPPLTLPDVTVLPELAIGSCAVAAVALAQAAGIGAVVPNPDRSAPSASADFRAQGAANLAGAFFGALPAGGSLSRTGVASSSGAQTRWAGIFAGLWLALALLVAGSLASYVPMPVIAALVLIIGIELIKGRWGDIVLVVRTARVSALAMLVTFIATTQLPLQQAIAVGAVTSILLYAGSLVHRLQVRALEPTDDGGWHVVDLPAAVEDRSVTIVFYGGITLFAAVARLSEQWPDTSRATRAVIVLDLSSVADVPSTVLVKALRDKAVSMREQGNLLLLADVEEAGERMLRESGALAALGEQNVYHATEKLFGSLRQAYHDAVAWTRKGAEESTDCEGDGPAACR